MLIGTSIDAPSLGDYFGTLAVAVGLTVDEFTPISAVAVVVRRARLGMTGGVGLSVTQRSNGIFLFSDLNE